MKALFFLIVLQVPVSEAYGCRCSFIGVFTSLYYLKNILKKIEMTDSFVDSYIQEESLFWCICSLGLVFTPITTFTWYHTHIQSKHGSSGLSGWLFSQCLVGCCVFSSFSFSGGGSKLQRSWLHCDGFTFIYSLHLTFFFLTPAWFRSSIISLPGHTSIILFHRSLISVFILPCLCGRFNLDFIHEAGGCITALRFRVHRNHKEMERERYLWQKQSDFWYLRVFHGWISSLRHKWCLGSSNLSLISDNVLALRPKFRVTLIE